MMPSILSTARRAARLRALLLSFLLLPLLGADAPDGAGATAWPQFRGPAASGVAGGDHRAPATWDVAAGKNVLWKAPVPGLGLSSPVVWGDRVFVTTAVSEKEVAAGEKANEELRVGLYGSIASVPDEGVLLWKVLCFDRGSGKLLWEHTAHRGRPQVKRHPKSSHANPTPATDGKRLVVFFGSEGLHCYDLAGKPLWKKDFGVLDSGFFTAPDAQWEFASSPVLHEGKVIVQVDVQKKQNNSFVAAFDAADGAPVWSTPRTDVPTWSTPTIVRDDKTGRTQVVCNGFEEMAGYDFATGKKLWKIGGGGDIPVPTPVHSPKHGLVYLASAHGPSAPLIALRTTAEGELKLPKDKEPAEHVAWAARRAGIYMQTPLVLGDLLYACRDNGVVACFDAATGKEHFRQRLEAGDKGFTASPVAADGKLYFTGESGDVVVLKAGEKFEVLATNTLGEPSLATPAISRGVIFFRTRSHLVAVGEAKEK